MSQVLTALLQLSSASRRIQCRNPIPRQWPTTTGASVVSIGAIRYASTTPAASQQSATPSPATPSIEQAPAASAAEASDPSFANLDTITLDNIDLSTTSDIANIPEKIGYLQEIGLNYGWGPTSMIEWCVEHIHIASGLPWWASVALTAVGIRAVMFPLYLKASDSTARQTAMMSVTKPLMDKIQEAKKSGDQQAMLLAWQEMSAIRRKAGVSHRAALTPLFLQGVIGYCGYKLMRAMAALPVPALQTDGFLWLQDMTLQDPFLLLPIAMAGTMHLMVRLGGESGAQAIDSMGPGMRTMMLWVMPGMILIVTGYQAGLVCVWFATSGALGMMQGVALRNPKFREYMKLAPVYKPQPGEAHAGIASVLAGGGRSGVAEAAKGRSTDQMFPSYQSPNLKRNPYSSDKVIDVMHTTKPSAPATHAAPADDMIQPNKPPESYGIFNKASAQFKGFKDRATQMTKLTPDQIADRKKADFKKRAAAYEKQSQDKRGR